MSGEWSLKGKLIKGLIIMPSDGMELHETSAPTPIRDEWVHKEHIETLRQKLIEDIKRAWWKDIDSTDILNIINKRFGVEEKHE